MSSKIDPYLTEPDHVVLQALFRDIDSKRAPDTAASGKKVARPSTQQDDAQDKSVIEYLKKLNDPDAPEFQPTVFVSWDDKDIPPLLNRYVVKPFARLARGVVRHPTDVVFLTHTLLYFCVNLPSAIWLFYRFTWLHAVAHGAFTFWCAGTFTLMMHNHIHHNGILSKPWWLLDTMIPYVTGPLLGHTWNSYYYHHVKHHHVEANGPLDLSSTIRYQRDSAAHFAMYVGRFLFFIWVELPLYFVRRGQYGVALRAGAWEVSSYVFMFTMFKLNPRATFVVLLLPFALLRLGLMVGNWGQHAFVDEIDPNSDLRSSITLIDVPSNRFCFNDGYHTAHHLNPRRHWRDHPAHLVKSKETYAKGRALVLYNIDYIMLTYRLLRKDYLYIAGCVVPIGDQIGMSREEIAALLKTKTKRFTEEDIARHFPAKKATATSTGVDPI